MKTQGNKYPQPTTSIDIKLDRLALDIKVRLKRLSLKSEAQIRSLEADNG